MLTGVMWILVVVLGILSQLLNAAAFFMYVDGYGGNMTIHSGATPTSNINAVGVPSIVAWVLGFVCLFFAITEILFLVPATQDFILDWFPDMFLRGFVYLVAGIPCLYYSGDLGVASGAISIMVGVVYICLGYLIGDDIIVSFEDDEEEEEEEEPARRSRRRRHGKKGKRKQHGKKKSSRRK